MVEIPHPADAPVRAVAEIVIAAPIDLVWAVQANLDSWPEWNHKVRSVDVLGPVTLGTTFIWKAGGMKIVSKLTEVDPPRGLAWTGRTLGLRAVHEWRFAEIQGGTHVRTQESFEGVLARLLPGWLTRSLKSSLESGLAVLRVECERRADRHGGE